MDRVNKVQPYKIFIVAGIYSVTLSLNIWRFYFLPLLFLSNAFLEIGTFHYWWFCVENKNNKTMRAIANIELDQISSVKDYLKFCVLREKIRPNTSPSPKQQQNIQKVFTK